MTIDQKYAQLGGASGFLGKPTTAETVCPDQNGHFRHYEHGSIYWTASTDAHEVHGAIRDKWSSLGWERSWLGYPTSDEQDEGGGARISHFENGFIDWSPANGAVDRFGLAFQAYHNVTSAQHQASHDQLKPLGWRMSSLCVYGSSPLYAAVWVKKSGPSWSAIHNATAAQWQAFADEWTAQNFRPTLVSATGSGDGAVFAAVMEQTSDPVPVTRHGLTPDDFVTWCNWAAQNNYILTTLALYGTSGDPRIIAVWDLNHDNTAFSANNTPWTQQNSLLEDFGQTQKVFDAENTHVARIYRMVPSDYSQWIAAYRGDSAGPFQAFTSLAASDYQAKFNALTPQGFYPDNLQIGGDSDNSATFSAIFTKRQAPLPKRFSATGAAQNGMLHFDEAIQGYMQRNSIRAASMAVAKGSKLVYARAFTWAEPGYPIAQPTDMFRIGSCSKCLTSILIHQLMQDNKLAYTDNVVNKLSLTPPPGQSIVNTNFANYNVWELLCHQSGIAKNFAQADATVVSLFNQQLPAKSKQEIASWLLTQKQDFDPGKQFEYANSGFLVLGAIVEKLRATEWFNVFKDKVITPLALKHAVVSGSLLSQRAAGEVLNHDNGLGVYQSVMSPDQPLVHDSYGNVNLAVGEAIGGMALAPADFVKILAALDLGKGDTNPVLATSWVNQMWSFRNDIAKNAGYGYGWGGGTVMNGAQSWGHEGALSNCHTFIEHRRDGYSVCMAFNTGQRPNTWAPDLDDLIDSTTDWPATDLFPSLGLSSL